MIPFQCSNAYAFFLYCNCISEKTERHLPQNLSWRHQAKDFRQTSLNSRPCIVDHQWSSWNKSRTSAAEIHRSSPPLTWQTWALLSSWCAQSPTPFGPGCSGLLSNFLKALRIAVYDALWYSVMKASEQMRHLTLHIKSHDYTWPPPGTSFHHSQVLK